MSDVLNTIAQANARMLELQKIRADAEASALAHEEQARTDRRTMSAAKVEMAELAKVLAHSRTVSAAESAEAAAKKAQADAEASRKEADAALERAKALESRLEAAVAKAEKPADQPAG